MRGHFHGACCRDRQCVLARLITALLRSRASALMLLPMSAGLLANDARAQGVRVGRLDSVVALMPQNNCRARTASEERRDSITLIRQGVSRPAWPNDSAVVLDQLLVRGGTAVRFRVETSPFGLGTFYFTPEFGRCPAPAGDLRVQGIQQREGARGSYRFSSSSERVGAQRRDRLVLTVYNGTAVIDWTRGQLSVFALGREIRDSGTVFVVVVDSIAQRAAVYVGAGIVTVGTGSSRLVTLRGEGFSFGPTGPLRVIALPAGISSELEYHSTTIWAPPPRSGPSWWKVAGSTALAGGGGFLVWKYVIPHPGPKSSSQQGNVIFRIPL